MSHTCSPLKGFEEKNKSCKECQRQASIECTCPDWWFPSEVREKARKIAHDFGGGMLAHHESCAKR